MSRPTRLLLVFAWLASIGIGYWFGSIRGSDPRLSAEPDAALVATGGGESPGALPPSTEVMEGAVAGPGLEADGLSVTALSMRDLARLSSDQLRALFSSASAMPKSDPSRGRLLTELLAELARTNPEEALQLAGQIESLRDYQSAREAILQAWGEIDPVAALPWAARELQSLPTALRHNQLRAIFRGYAENNAAAAFRTAREFELTSPGDRRLRGELMEEVVEMQVRAGEVNAAIAAVAALPADSPVKDDLLQDLVDEWASFDPGSAAAYVSSLGDQASAGVKSGLLSEWAESDPVAAAEWLGRLSPDDPAISRSATEIIREWARYDLTASAEWLNSLPASPELDRAIASYTYRAAQEDPGSAMSWAESISNERMRGGMMERVAATWRDSDPAAFTAYLESSELNDEQRERLQNAESRGGGWWRYR